MTPTVVEVTPDTGKTPLDPGHDELVLLAQLSSTNTRIANYIARILDLDQGRTQYTKPLAEAERELSENLLALGQSLLSHAQHPHRTTHRHCATTPTEPSQGRNPL